EGSPVDLEGKKALLNEKKTALTTLEHEVAQLEKEIAELDPSTKTKRTPVTTIQLERRDFEHFIDIQGTVQSDERINISSETGGRILDLKVQEGQTVSKGQLVALLDLEQIEKQIAEVQTSLDLAQEVYERQKRLWDQNIGSEIQYLQAKNNKERLEKSLETLQFQLDKSKVYAPISGVVETVVLKAGELAGPGAPIVQVLNTNQVKVVAEVPENYLQAIRKGEWVTVKFPALDTEQKARVSLIGSTINPGNRTFSVEVDLSNPRGLLKPNLLAIMLLNDYSQTAAVVVPLEVVQQEVGGKSYVFVKGEGQDGALAKKVYVKTGQTYRGEVVITNGLTGEEELILEGARGLADQEPIEIQQG
ncbi:MAG: efflux RND transporter periplasmic adaptor subunit, partial [Saprospiraceae bacterium]|nr:efflux RND transporter periplasmic adaptor subunit [Saprospiraceae bacterium]